MIAAIVLGAGLSRRMGEAKLLLDLAGKPVIRRTVESLVGQVEDIVVVAGHEAHQLQTALEGLPVRFTRNPRPEAGQGSSIATGVSALRPETEAALIVLGDQPGLPDSLIGRLIDRFRDSGKPIVVPVYRDGPGNPVLFGRLVFGELAALTGDGGGKALVHAQPERAERLVLDCPMPPDIDTPQDYARLQVQYS